MGPTVIELRERRLAAGLTQRELAERTGIPQPNISDYERGRRIPSPETTERIAAATRRRPSDVLAEARDQVRAAIQRHHGLEAWVFGSTARGDDTPDSDLDLLVRFDNAATGLGRVADYLDIKEELEALLGCPVDVLDHGGLKPWHGTIRKEMVPL